jgi:hypothetical protein
MTYQERQQIEARAERFAAAFGPDAIDAALAAVDEAILVNADTPDQRELLKKRCLYNVGAAFFQKAGYSFVVVNPE